MGKVLTWAEAGETVGKLRKGGSKIVFTNGCFDIIHIGHVRYLREAKALGDVMFIGLNSDQSVSAIKPGRPVNNQEQRAEVLASLEMVDYVVIFDETTPYELIKLVQPDVLVKGGDWKKEEIVGNDIAKETFSLPYIEGVSTTEIISRMKKL